MVQRVVWLFYQRISCRKLIDKALEILQIVFGWQRDSPILIYNWCHEAMIACMDFM